MDKQQFYTSKKQHLSSSPVKSFTYYSVIIIFLGAISFAAFFYIAVIEQLPSLAQLENPPQEFSTKILDADGNLLENFYIKRRNYTPYDSIPQAFFTALISTEDREFYSHWGVHSMRIAKAFVKNVGAFRLKEGASTITQQLARNLYFTFEQSMLRKLREAATAVQLERTYTKNEILEMYANTVNFGRGSYGISVASHVYFGKTPYNLTPSECAYLVGVLKAPTYYDARENYEKAIMRRNTVLMLMEENGAITAAQRYKYSDEEINLYDGSKSLVGNGMAPHFVEMIRKKLNKDERLAKYDIYRDGLTIYTTLNAKMQRYTEEAVEEEMSSFQAEFDKMWSWTGKQELLQAILTKAAKERPEFLNAKTDEQRMSAIRRFLVEPSFIDSVKRAVTTIQTGVVVIEPSTGAIVSLVGASPLSMSRISAAKYSLNHVSEIKRQPGSAFKPIVYASAMEESKLSPESGVSAAGFSLNGWSPSGSRYGGSVSLRTAMKFSINSVAARLITQYTRPAKVVALARKMGITTQMDPYPSLSLGVEEVYPLDMAAAYCTFVNNGIAVPAVAIKKIEDKNGNIIYNNKLPAGIIDAIDPKVCKNLVSMMRGVVDGGTASSIRKYYDYDAAGKTGTTNDYADAWFVGFTPQLVCAVWVGFDDRRIKFTGAYGQGGKAAAPIWGRVMQKIYADEDLGIRQKMFGTKDSTVRRVSKRRANKVMQEGEIAPATTDDEDDSPQSKPNENPEPPPQQPDPPPSKPSTPPDLGILLYENKHNKYSHFSHARF